MTTFALNNLWSYLQGLSLAQSDREWLASKLIEPEVKATKTDKEKATAEISDCQKVLPMTPEVAMLSNLNLKEFTTEELDTDPLLAAIVEDRRLRK